MLISTALKPITHHPNLLIMKRLPLTFLLAISILVLKAQQTVSIGTTTTNNKAVLLLSSAGGNQGLIIPIVSNKSAVSATGTEKGMIVFDDSDKKLYCHNGTAWVEISTGAGAAGTYTMVLSGNNLQLMNGAAVASTIPLGTDILNSAGTLTVNGLKGKAIPALPGTTQALVYNGTAWVFQSIAAGTGDITGITTNAGSGLSGGVATGDAILTLTNTGVTAATYGSGTAIPQITVDAQGRITNVTTVVLPDASATNEIQNLAVAGAAGSATPGEVFNLNISSGSGVTITEGTNVDITRSGTNLTIGASGSVTGTAGGDLTGTYPNPTIAAGAISGGTTGDILDNTITNADIFATAAIAGTKIAPNFGTQNIQTSGTLTSGAITATNLASINTVPYTWPATQGAANTVLSNNGSGALSWTTAPSPFSTANVIPKGSGSTLMASQIYANTTGVGINTTNPAVELQIDGTTPNLRLRSTQSNTLSQAHVEFGHDDGSGGFTSVGSIGDVGSTDGLELFSPFQINFNVNFASRFNLGPNGQVGVGSPISYGTAGQVLTSGGGSGPAVWSSISGFSTPNEVPRSDGANLLSSNIFSDGTNVGIGALSGGYLLDVNKTLSSATDTQIRTFNPTSGTSVKSGIRFQTGGGWAVQLQTSEGDNWLELTNNGGVPYHHWTYDSYFPGSSGTGYLQGLGTGLALMGGNVGVNYASPGTDLEVAHVTGFPGNGSRLRNTSINHFVDYYVAAFAGDLWLGFDGVHRGTFDAASGAYATVSDRRMKKDIEQMGSVLPEVMKLQPKKYYFLSQNASRPKNFGFIAQEVEKIFPSLVKYSEEDDRYTMEYSGFGVIAVKAIQEQQAIIETQSKEIETLRAELDEVKKMVQALVDKK
jgi:hypothetical protein